VYPESGLVLVVIAGAFRYSKSKACDATPDVVTLHRTLPIPVALAGEETLITVYLPATDDTIPVTVAGAAPKITLTLPGTVTRGKP
jgi:hypothetical protein